MFGVSELSVQICLDLLKGAKVLNMHMALIHNLLGMEFLLEYET